ncbi:CocE/NonD family hydrolase C-terminal non-catalytic domain-containing protein [Streptomyces sp. NPDC002746]
MGRSRRRGRHGSVPPRPEARRVRHASAAVHRAQPGRDDPGRHRARCLDPSLQGDGRLRVSIRRLDEKLSTDDVPAHSFDQVEKLSPGEVVDVEIDLLPVGLTFQPGEQLRLVISSRSLLGTMMPGIREYTTAFGGRHIVHTGGDRASYVQLPVKPA